MRFSFPRVALLLWMLIGLARITTGDEHAAPSTMPSDESAAIVADFGDDDGTIISSAFSPDGKLVVTASVNRNVVVWDWQQKKAILTLQGKGDLAFIMPDNRTLAVSNMGVLSTWDLITGKKLRQLADVGEADCVALTGRDGELLCGGRFGELGLWNVQTGKITRAFLSPPHGVRCIAVSAGGKFAVSSSIDGIVRVWNLQNRRPDRQTGRRRRVV